MTRKDYETLAACIGRAMAERQHYLTAERDLDAAERAIFDVSQRIENECAYDNPRFNRDRFRAAVQKHASAE